MCIIKNVLQFYCQCDVMSSPYQTQPAAGSIVLSFMLMRSVVLEELKQKTHTITLYRIDLA